MFIQTEALVLGTKATGSAKWSGKLFCYGKLVDAVEVNVGLNRFGLWLKNFAVG